MTNNNSFFQNRPLARAINYMAYFLLLTFVTPGQSTIRVIAGILLGATLVWVIIRFIRAWKGSIPAVAVCSRSLEDRLSEALIPVGFLVLAIVMTAPGSRILPLLYVFLGLYVLAAIVRIACKKV